VGDAPKLNAHVSLALYAKKGSRVSNNYPIRAKGKGQICDFQLFPAFSPLFFLAFSF
jgi:hypothetical protein